VSDIDRTLQALGFVAGDDGVPHAPESSRVTLAPIGTFFELRISMGDRTAIVAVLSKSAVKVTREATPPEAAVDADTLIVPTTRR
jgi:hypothetical protein